MTRARAFTAAVPQRVWTAVAGLALLASLAVAAVIGAGLQVWRSAIGSTAEPPRATVEPPASGLVILPGGRTARPHVRPIPATPIPATQPPAAEPPGTSGTPVAFGPRGFTPLVVTAGGVDRRVAVPLTGRADQLGTPGSEAESEADLAASTFAAHARPQEHVQARGKHHSKHGHRPHAAKHRHGGRHR